MKQLSRKDKPERDGKRLHSANNKSGEQGTPCLYTSSNVVAHKIEINTANSISKFQIENIKN